MTDLCRICGQHGATRYVEPPGGMPVKVCRGCADRE